MYKRNSLSIRRLIVMCALLQLQRKGLMSLNQWEAQDAVLATDPCNPPVLSHLEKPFAHAGSCSAHQPVQAEIVIGVKFGLHDVEGALCCGVQAHVAAHVIQRQTVLAVGADISQHFAECQHTCNHSCQILKPQILCHPQYIDLQVTSSHGMHTCVSMLGILMIRVLACIVCIFMCGLDTMTSIRNYALSYSHIQTLPAPLMSSYHDVAMLHIHCLKSICMKIHQSCLPFFGTSEQPCLAGTSLWKSASSAWHVLTC